MIQKQWQYYVQCDCCGFSFLDFSDTKDDVRKKYPDWKFGPKYDYCPKCRRTES